MTNATNATNTPTVTLKNDTRFEDLIKEVEKEGAKVKAAENAGQKASDSQPNVALKIVDGAHEGYIDIVAHPEQTTTIYRAYRKAIGNPITSAKLSTSDGIQVSKFDSFAKLGAQKAFNGSEAMAKIVRIFLAGKEAQAKATKEAPAPKLESKFVAYLQAARLINAETGTDKPRYPRLDPNDKSDWKDSELSDSEIAAAMHLAPKKSKSAHQQLVKLVEQLESIINGSKKDSAGEKIEDKSQAVINAHALLKQHVGIVTLTLEREAFEKQAREMGVSMEQLNAYVNPKPRAKRTRSQRRG